MSLNPIKGSFEHSVLLSVENVEDEEGQEHEEMSVEHSLSNSRLLFMGSSKSSLAHSEKEECDEDRENAHVPKAVIDNLLNSVLLSNGHIWPGEVSVVGVTPWELLLLDDEDSFESSINQLFEAHEHG
jgi:hypothetical protein